MDARRHNLLMSSFWYDSSLNQVTGSSLYVSSVWINIVLLALVFEHLDKAMEFPDHLSRESNPFTFFIIDPEFVK